MRNTWVYDIETYKEYFCLVAMNIDTLEVIKFEIGAEINELEDLLDFLRSRNLHLIGFNNNRFDWPVCQYILKNIKVLRKTKNPSILIYQIAQNIITDDDFFMGEWTFMVPQVDLFKIHHFDNEARRTSLKQLEVAMRWDNVQDLPYHHTDIIDRKQQKEVLAYCENDVRATHKFYLESKEEIEFRKSIVKSYNIPAINFNDTRIGAELVIRMLSQETGIPRKQLAGLRTHRKIINLDEVIFDFISFQSQEFNKLLEFFKLKKVVKTKGAIEHSVIFRGFKYDYGLGGIHGSVKSGIYESDDDYIILDVDVKSYYPNIAIVNNKYPEHFGNVFCGVYKKIYDMRAKTPKSNPINGALKLALNGVYGKSNSWWSFFYDPKYTMTITVNGQLMLTMLAEKLVLAGAEMLQVNTDGLTIKIKRNELDKFKELCQEWEQLTKLELEYAEYKKMIIRDVNNYIAVYDNGNIKLKGAFEIDKQWHKDPSMRIVPIALKKYFVDGIPIRDTINSHDDIYDFCKMYKATAGWSAEYRYVKDGKVIIDNLSKTTRYYVSKHGGRLIKVHEDGREIQVEAGKIVTIFNKKEDNYEVDRNYYIQECQKIIDVIEDKQLELF